MSLGSGNRIEKAVRRHRTEGLPSRWRHLKPKRPLGSFGLLESERQYLLACKAALEAKDTELEKEQQKLQGEFKKTTDANDYEKERTQARPSLSCRG